ncbi:16854_t:CDS:2, partial [Dentiscutata erythropus]
MNTDNTANTSTSQPTIQYYPNNHQQGTSSSTRHNHEFNAATTLQQTKQTDQSTAVQQGNCPLTPLLNNLIINSPITQPSADTTITPSTQHFPASLIPRLPTLRESDCGGSSTVGNFVDLIKFNHKTLKANMKYNEEEQTLQTAEGGVIAIRNSVPIEPRFKVHEHIQ